MLILFERILNPLLGMSITAAFVAVVVILLRAILKNRAPKQVVCLLWLLVFARLLVPVMVESPFSLVPNALESVVQVEQNEVQNQPEPSVPVESITPAPTNEPVIEITPAVTPGNPVPSLPVSNPTQDPITEAPPVIEPSLIPEVPPAEEPEVQEPTVEPTSNAPVWMSVLAAVWLTGVAVMLVVGIGSYVKLRRRVYDAIRTADGVWEHPSLASPFILGLFRPKIYLPMGIEGQSRQFILHHERAHLRRLDHVVKPICWLALAIHWFNPLAWVAFLLLSRDIETACDESVIRQLGDGVKADYSATLLALATDKRFPAPSPLSFGEGDAKVRIKNVLKFKKPALWVTIAAAVVAVVAAVCLLTDPVDKFNPDDYTTLDCYPGLYFEEVTDERTGATTTKAYKLEKSKPALVAGWSNHPADNVATLIHPDGEKEVLLATLWEIIARYEQYLVDYMMEQDEGWGERYIKETDNLITILSVVASDLQSSGHIGDSAKFQGGVTCTPEQNLLFCWDGSAQVLPLQTSVSQNADSVKAYAYDRAEDGTDRLDILWKGGRKVYSHEPSGSLIFEGDALITYIWDGETWAAHDSVYDITTADLPVGLDIDEQQICIFKYDDSRETLTFPIPEELGKVVTLCLSGQAKIARREDGDYDLTYGVFAMPEGKNSDADWVHVMDVTAIMTWNSLTEKYDIDAIEPKVDFTDLPADDPIINPTPLSAVGELFQSALNDEIQIVDPGLNMTATLSELVAATAPSVEMNITEMAAVDLDGDGIDEVLLQLETTIPISTLILRYDSTDEQIYAYELWLRMFGDVKTDGTFYYSSSVGGIARISFDSDGYEQKRITYREESEPNRTVRYFVNQQSASKAEYEAAYKEWSEQPGVTWVEYTFENIDILLRENFAKGYNPSMFTKIDALPDESAILYVDADGQMILQVGEYIGPISDDVWPVTATGFSVTLTKTDRGSIALCCRNQATSGLDVSVPVTWSAETGMWVRNGESIDNSSKELPRELVTPDTLPTDPEEYYLVAALPENHVYLYAKNHGEDSMLLWNGNFWWPLTGRTAHTPRMNLPRLYLMDENAQTTTVAAISERASGTEVSVEQLVVYVMGEYQVDSSYYTGLKQSVYDWSSVHEAFNKKNTLVYDADTNSFTVFWNGRVYNSGELPQDMGYRFALEDGYTGSLFANGDITKFTYIGGNRFVVTVKTAVEGQPMSIGATGLDLTWTVEFNGEGFDLVGEINLGSEIGVNQSPSATGSENGAAELPNGWKLNDFTIAGFDKDGLGDFGYRAVLSEDELESLPELLDLAEWQQLTNPPEYGLTVCLALTDSDAECFLYVLDGMDGKAVIKLSDPNTGESFVYLASEECITYAKALAAVLKDRAS